MNKFLACTLFLVFLAVNTVGQTIITGIVSGDTDNTPLAYVNVVVKSKENGNILFHTRTDNEGQYTVSLKKSGCYLISFLSMPYQVAEEEFCISEQEEKKLVRNIKLIEKVYQVDEIVIRPDMPILIKKDTIVFDVKSFLKGNEEVVEDIFKALPGIEVDKEGVVRANGKEVEKIMVEGDDFFKKGYALLTKSMQSRAIKNVELIQRYSENNLLKNIENSDKVAINLTLSEEVKRQWFGNVSVEYEPNERHQLLLNLMNMGKKDKQYLTFNKNNIGYDAGAHLEKMFADEEAGDKNEFVPELVTIYSRPDNLEEKRTYINDAITGSVNSIFRPKNNLKIQLSAIATADKNPFSQYLTEEYQSEELSFLNNTHYEMKRKQKEVIGNLNVEYALSETTQIKSESQFLLQQTEDNNHLLFNGEKKSEALDTDREIFMQTFNITRKLSDRKAIVINGKYKYEYIPQDFRLNTESQSSHIRQNLGQATFTYLDRKVGGNLLELTAGTKYTEDDLFSQVDGITNNELNYCISNSWLGGKYLIRLKQITMIGKAAMHYYNYSFTGKSRKSLLRIDPSISLEWKSGKRNTVTAAFIHNYATSSVNDIYDGYVLTGFNTRQKGSGEPQMLRGYTGLLTYQYGSWASGLFGNITALYLHNTDYYTQNILLTPEYSTSWKAIAKDRELLSIVGTLDCYLAGLSSNLKLSSGFYSSAHQYQINDNTQELQTRSYNIGAEFKSVFFGAFNFQVGNLWSKNITSQIQNKVSYFQNKAYLDLFLRLGDRFNLSVNSEWMYFDKKITSRNNYFFLDAKAKYELKRNKLSFTFSAMNLINTDKFINYSVNDTYITNSSYQILPRIILFGVQYNF